MQVPLIITLEHDHLTIHARMSGCLYLWLTHEKCYSPISLRENFTRRYSFPATDPDQDRVVQCTQASRSDYSANVIDTHFISFENVLFSHVCIRSI